MAYNQDVRGRRSRPPAHAAHYVRSRLQRLKRRAHDAKPQPRLWSIKRPGPLPSKEDPRAARAPGSGNFNPRKGAGVRRSPRGTFEAKRTPQVLMPRCFTDQRLEGWLA
jgi:hypothetical protein